MSTNFGLAGIPGTRLKVCGWGGGVGWGGGGSHTHYCITPVPILGAGALMLNAWDWTVTICSQSVKSLSPGRHPLSSSLIPVIGTPIEPFSPSPSVVSVSAKDLAPKI